MHHRPPPFPAPRAVRRTPRPRRQGAAAVELALLLPLLLLFMLGAVDFGRFAHAYLGVTNSARAGAGYASMHDYTASSKPAWDDALRATARAEMQYLMDADPAHGENDLVVTAVRTIEADGYRRVAVDVAYPFDTLVRWPGIPAHLELRRVVVMPVVR